MQSIKKIWFDYLKFAFIQEAGSELDPRLLCIMFFWEFNDALKDPLQSEHPDLAKKPFECFRRVRENMQKQVGALKKYGSWR